MRLRRHFKDGHKGSRRRHSVGASAQCWIIINALENTSCTQSQSTHLFQLEHKQHDQEGQRHESDDLVEGDKHLHRHENAAPHSSDRGIKLPPSHRFTTSEHSYGRFTTRTLSPVSGRCSLSRTPRGAKQHLSWGLAAPWQPILHSPGETADSVVSSKGGFDGLSLCRVHVKIPSLIHPPQAELHSATGMPS